MSRFPRSQRETPTLRPSASYLRLILTPLSIFSQGIEGEYKKETATLEDIIDRMSKTSRKAVVIETMYSEIRLQGITIPSDDEWRSVEKHGRTDH